MNQNILLYHKVSQSHLVIQNRSLACFD